MDSIVIRVFPPINVHLLVRKPSTFQCSVFSVQISRIHKTKCRCWQNWYKLKFWGHLKCANGNTYAGRGKFIYVCVCVYIYMPVTVAERSKTCTVFVLSEAGIMGSNPTQSLDVWCVYAFIPCLCCPVLGTGLTKSCSPVQGVLPAVKMIKKLINQPYAPKWEQVEEKKNI
jgi:hypothetical protein